jgi:hypothetical protein
MWIFRCNFFFNVKLVNPLKGITSFTTRFAISARYCREKSLSLYCIIAFITKLSFAFKTAANSIIFLHGFLFSKKPEAYIKLAGSNPEFFFNATSTRKFEVAHENAQRH